VPPVITSPLPLAVVASADGWLVTCVSGVLVKEALYSETMFCWYAALRAPTPMSNERFCQNTSLAKIGYEILVQVHCGSAARIVARWAGDRPNSDEGRVQLRAVLHGHQTRGLRQRRCAVLRSGWGGDWVLAKGAPRVLKSTPDEAVVSLEIIVLLIRFTTKESSNDTPPPSQPATLLAMMLLVTLTEYH